jgi:hypothetical protein
MAVAINSAARLVSSRLPLLTSLAFEGWSLIPCLCFAGASLKAG